MATKKDKRTAGLAKHEAFLEQVRQDGLKAQEKDRQRREARTRQREAESLALEKKRDRRIEKTRRELRLEMLRETRREMMREVALAGHRTEFATQGGGTAVRSGEELVWLEVPEEFPEFSVGDPIPEEWGVAPITPADEASIEQECI